MSDLNRYIGGKRFNHQEMSTYAEVREMIDRFSLSVEQVGEIYQKFDEILEMVKGKPPSHGDIVYNLTRFFKARQCVPDREVLKEIDEAYAVVKNGWLKRGCKGEPSYKTGSDK